MKDQLISYETAKLANEKGFNEYYSYIDSFYVIKADLWEQDHHNGNDFLMYKEGEVISSSEPPVHPGVKYTFIGKRPNQSFLQKWLREKHNLHIFIQPRTFQNITMWHVFVARLDNYPFVEDFRMHSDTPDCFFYEEALEKGLLEALNLI